MASAKFVQTKIVIVGADFGGLTMAVELKKAGEDDFMIPEKHADVGCVWRNNTYPGCTGDVPSHLYSFLWRR
jgi:cation diffusion facilitator CzcD-associated flavoprotein CzcO